MYQRLTAWVAMYKIGTASRKSARKTRLAPRVGPGLDTDLGLQNRVKFVVRAHAGEPHLLIE